MLSADIQKQLDSFSKIEIKQRKTHHFVDDIPLESLDLNRTLSNGLPTIDDTLFKNSNVYISKHNRFADYPCHGHNFLEINYMFKGKCHQKVNNQEITLHSGDILIMDVGSRHSIKALGDNDILINIIFRNHEISISLLNDIQQNNSLTYGFLSNAALGKKNHDDSSILFKHNYDIDSTVDEIINEYYQSQKLSAPIIDRYMSILFSKFVRHYPQESFDNFSDSDSNTLITSIINDIHENYATITLEDLAKKYGYNKAYISSLIKINTGENFRDLRTNERLLKARYLFINSSDSINKIIDSVGINNHTFFFKKYREKYHCLPNETRKGARRLQI